jgi:hypothetical protein
MLKGTRPGTSLGRRLLYRAAFVLGMPIATVLAMLESLAGRGGTIEVWASTPVAEGAGDAAGPESVSGARSATGAAAR